MNLFKKTRGSIYTTTLFLSSVAIGMLMLLTPRYEIRIVSEIAGTERFTTFYVDLDHDGSTEKIEYYSYADGMTGVQVYKGANIIYSPDMRGSLAYSDNPFYDDYDNDGKDELITFTKVSDSLYFSVLDPINGKTDSGPVFIDKLIKWNGGYNYYISPIGTEDTDNDGLKEIYFSINSGYSVYPRKVYCYHSDKSILVSSPESCANIDEPNMIDLDGDSLPEIICSNAATGNGSEAESYSDQFGWLMVFDYDLSFKFAPIKTGVHPSQTYVRPLTGRTKKYILAFHRCQGTQADSNYLALVDARGRFIDYKLLEDNLAYGSSLLDIPGAKEPYLMLSDGKIASISEDLSLFWRARIKDIYQHYCSMDIDGDGKSEHIFIGSNRSSLVITRMNFRNKAVLNLRSGISNTSLSPISTNGYRSNVCFSSPKYNIEFTYGPSTIWHFWYFFLAAILLLNYFLMLIIRRLYEVGQLRLEKKQRYIAELQVRSIQNQLDPHFTFNLLQAFGTLISEKDTDNAEFLFNKYAGMLRTIILSADKPFTTLGEELRFVSDYLDLEKLRMMDRFDYQVNVSQGVDESMNVPKMLLHIFVENAVKHGIRPKQGRGKISIKANQRNGKTLLQIEDNGVGREEAGKSEPISTGRGLKIMDEMLDLYYQLYKTKIEYLFSDLVSDGLPSGTRVTIIIG